VDQQHRAGHRRLERVGAVGGGLAGHDLAGHDQDLLVGEAEVVAGLGRRWPRPDAPGSDVNDVSAALLRFATPDGYIPGTLTATCLLHGRQAIQLQLVCEGRVLTLSDRSLVVETGRASETEELTTATDPFLVENQIFLDAVRAHAPERVLCTYADALASHRLAVQVRQALGGP
jgi:predicted dehydrogenase